MIERDVELRLKRKLCGAVIAEVRAQGLTQAQVMEKTGASAALVSYVMRGAADAVSFGSLAGIAALLGILVDLHIAGGRHVEAPRLETMAEAATMVARLEAVHATAWPGVWQTMLDEARSEEETDR